MFLRVCNKRKLMSFCVHAHVCFLVLLCLHGDSALVFFLGFLCEL